ncbi:MAG: TIGR04282 family arsenosugar biosynthesis glycosyltransferase, partial [Rubrivivax sp.]|nr:TIGR04282 family arsenosugar biosynthesis glycosyltransferase [Rubrivivax sp.]
MKLCRVALMAKAPEPGLAKTRLVPALGDAGAAALAARLLAHALQQALEAQPDSVTLWTAPDASHPAFVRASWLGVVLAVQPEGDLGQRMARVFEAGFAQGDTPVLLMGTDAPTLGASVLQAAAAELERHDVVFVPAHDGGYALVGLRAPPAG